MVKYLNLDPNHGSSSAPNHGPSSQTFLGPSSLDPPSLRRPSSDPPHWTLHLLNLYLLSTPVSLIFLLLPFACHLTLILSIVLWPCMTVFRVRYQYHLSVGATPPLHIPIPLFPLPLSISLSCHPTLF